MATPEHADTVEISELGELLARIRSLESELDDDLKREIDDVLKLEIFREVTGEDDSAMQALKLALRDLRAEVLGAASLLVCPGSATAEELGELFAEMSALYRMMGGAGIDFTMRDVRTVAFETTG